MSRRPVPHSRAHRARIAADAMPVLIVQTVMLAMVWAASISVSFTGLVAAASWANVTGVERFGVPVFIDGILVGASLAYLVARERHDGPSAWIALAAMLGFVSLSITGNATHALAAHAVGAQRVTGVLLAVAAPIAIIVTTELLARTVIAPPPAPKAAPAAASLVALPAAAPASASVPTSGARPRAARPVAPRPVLDDAARAEARQEAMRLASEGLSQRQIAAAVGASKSAVARWLSAAEVTV